MDKVSVKTTSIINLSVGDILVNTKGLSFKVTEYLSSRKVRCKFLVSGYETDYVQAGNVIRGTVKDLKSPSVEGVGYIGQGDAPTMHKGVVHPLFDSWKKMIVRCYSDNYQETRPTYKGCSVDINWHDYQEFYKWAKVNYKYGYQLDKDILVKGNKVYSPTTCCYVPREINALVTDNKCKRGDSPLGTSKRKKKGTSEFNGVYNVACSSPSGLIYLGRVDCEEKGFERYKEFKSFLLKFYGETYYERGLIPREVCEALVRREILITD